MKSIWPMMLLTSWLTAAPLLAQGTPAFDLVIRGGRVLDGSGNPWIRADVGVRGDRITAVGDLSGSLAKEVLEVPNLYVAPGFIDVHSHAGPALETVELSLARPLLAQGVTTVVINPDGGGPADLEAQRLRLQEFGLGVNVALLVPHGTVRRQVLGAENRPPSFEELDAMRGLVDRGMRVGAYGLSSGLFYAPGNFASTDEIVELARVVARHGGVYTSHIRDEADYGEGVVAAVEEVIRVAEQAGLPGIVTHIKALGPNVWGASAQLIKRIERAREAGTQVFADQYPYEASATGLAAALVPRWAEAGGQDAMLERLADPSGELLADIAENLKRRAGAGRIAIRTYPPDPSLEGWSLQQVAEHWSLSPLDAALTLIRRGGAGIVSFNMDTEDVERLMVQPWVMTCSDGGLTLPAQGVPHPRNYGAFPRKIRRYVLEQRLLDLASAVRSMTSLPAAVFGFQGRGRIAPGSSADIVIFDLNRIRDRATYTQPHQLAEGVVHLLVNGSFAVRDGVFSEEPAGRVLSR